MANGFGHEVCSCPVIFLAKVKQEIAEIGRILLTLTRLFLDDTLFLLDIRPHQ